MPAFYVALIFDFMAAAALVFAVARLLRSHASPALLSYLFYLIFWYTLVLYMLIFLFAPRFLPESAQRAHMLFNSIFIVPLNGFIAFFFADFVWRWLEKPMPRLLRFGLPVPFLVILVIYVREILRRLSADIHSQTFTLSAPASLTFMFVCLFLVSFYAIIASRRLKDTKRRGYMQVFGAVMVSGLALGTVFVFGVFSFLGMEWQNSVTSMVLVSVNIAAWICTRRFFHEQNRAAATELERADLSVLEIRYGISPRERDVISLVIAGKSNREITEKLFISQETVKKHIYNVYRKIGVRNRVQLANVVLEMITALPHDPPADNAGEIHRPPKSDDHANE